MILCYEDKYILDKYLVAREVDLPQLQSKGYVRYEDNYFYDKYRSQSKSLRPRGIEDTYGSKRKRIRIIADYMLPLVQR